MSRISDRLFLIIQIVDDLNIGRENSIGIMSYKTCALAAHFAVDDKTYSTNMISLVANSRRR